MAGLFSSFFGKKQVRSDYSFLATDIHSHLLPGIDDGAKTLEDSLTLIRGLYELGFRKLVTTPHIMEDFYRNTPEIIHARLEEVRKMLERNRLDISIEAAAEYYMDAHFIRLLQENQLLTFGNKYVLFEISFSFPPVNLSETIFNLQVKGYKPVMAHPERYPYWHRDTPVYEKLRATGLLFMVNTNSFSNYYGTGPRKVAEWLADKGWIDFLASDVHSEKHIRALKHTLQESYINKLAAPGVLLNPSL